MAYEKSSYNWKVVAHEYKSITMARLENEIKMNKITFKALSRNSLMADVPQRQRYRARRA
jgi:hypothetical protein